MRALPCAALLVLAVVHGGCKCIDLSELTAFACEQDGTCAEGVCCDGFCRATCGDVDGGKDGGGTARLCSPVTCRGCCNGDICEIGTGASTCGQGGQDCQTCPAGQDCQGGGCSGCNSGNCSDGCCFSGACEVPTPARCGADGGVCKDCALLGGDRCQDGTCFCGSGPACGLGQQCNGGACECNPSSCAGCCINGGCVLSPGLSACGTAGAACQGCDPKLADRCTTGACSCGAGPACAVGQACVNGACECDPLTCAGCCEGTTCRPGDHPGRCGAGGVTCQECASTCVNQQCTGCSAANCASGCCSGGNCVGTGGQSTMACGTGGAFCNGCGVRSDNCAGGGCHCGGGPVCAAGQRCLGGACVCDSTSCLSGCCDSTGSCINQGMQSPAQCGTAGQACGNCAPRGDTCGVAGCKCGGGSLCAVGQVCVGGACACTAASCSSGCCNGNQCTTQSSGVTTDGGQVTCGVMGNLCTGCFPGRSDRCGAVAGDCRCGLLSAQCSAGQQCIGGTCVCNAASCPFGCCDTLKNCRPPSAAECGGAGAACGACTGATVDACVSGACSCGTSGFTCGPGTDCRDGRCTCDPGTCPNGCCQPNGVCVDGPPDFPSRQFCGAGGSCVGCTISMTEVCNGGICEKCAGCAGCCLGSFCQLDSVSGEAPWPYCGKGGNACSICRDGGSDSCSGESCSCGALGRECKPGEKCVAGNCVCDPTTCPGCCTNSGNNCVWPTTPNQCGMPGTTCSNCIPSSKSDRCVGGACRCGNGPPCLGINTCQAGVCQP